MRRWRTLRSSGGILESIALLACLFGERAWGRAELVNGTKLGTLGTRTPIAGKLTMDPFQQNQAQCAASHQNPKSQSLQQRPNADSRQRVSIQTSSDQEKCYG